MKGALFSIGIDLGTTNSALAFSRLEDERSVSEVFPIPQWENLSALIEASTLPSFLYLPTEAEAAQLARQQVSGKWIVGRFARKQAAEVPGRVAHSAKSWLCHHAVDRTANFLPWASESLTDEQKISPVEASALILACFRSAWNEQWRSLGPQGAFDAQEITITVPASFDAVAQRLTLEAARRAGFPGTIRLLEEPQAAFYRWLERPNSLSVLKGPLGLTSGGGQKHILVIDVGGGTSDFSLFGVQLDRDTVLPDIERLAVSDHILLGGDNVDLALAYLVRSRLEEAGHVLGGAQWPYLVARCRDLKERVLQSSDGEGQELFTLSIPGTGSSLLAGTLTARLTRSEILNVLLDGFFTVCERDVEPDRAQAGLKEWGLPYASDSAITHYLAEFLKDRPRVDAVLFNGGTLYPDVLRDRLVSQLGDWQQGHTPLLLDNPEPDLAVARGAARFGWLTHRKQARIEAGAAQSIYLEVQQESESENKSAPSLVCILPRGTGPEEDVTVRLEGLRLRVNQPVRFQPYQSTRRSRDKAGSLTQLEKGIYPLPVLQTVIRVPDGVAIPEDGRIPVELGARLNSVGLLQVACVSQLEGLDQSWPLDFNLRRRSGGSPIAAGDPGVPESKINEGKLYLANLFTGKKREKVTPARIFKNLEGYFDLPKHEWNWMLLRNMWPTLKEQMEGRRLSIEHEEAWLSIGGYLLRPGYGAELDETRIEELWEIKERGLAYPSKRVKLQEYILWRRVSGGLSKEQQESILKVELPKLQQQKNPPAELVRMCGAFERIPQETKLMLIEHCLRAVTERQESGGYAEPYYVALTLLLNRAPLYAGPEAVVPPDQVERAFEQLKGLDWEDDAQRELRTLFLRAARVIDNPYLDLPKAVRKKIASKLEKAGVPPVKAVPVRDFVPLAQADQVSVFGESLPPGIVLS